MSNIINAGIMHCKEGAPLRFLTSVTEVVYESSGSNERDNIFYVF